MQQSIRCREWHVLRDPEEGQIYIDHLYENNFFRHQTGSETEIKGGRVKEAVDTDSEAFPFKKFGCK